MLKHEMEELKTAHYVLKYNVKRALLESLSEYLLYMHTNKGITYNV